MNQNSYDGLFKELDAEALADLCHIDSAALHAMAALAAAPDASYVNRVDGLRATALAAVAEALRRRADTPGFRAARRNRERVREDELERARAVGDTARSEVRDVGHVEAPRPVAPLRARGGAGLKRG